MDGGPITSFSGTFRFLSNFWPAPTTYEGVLYPTSEHAYQAAKVVGDVAKKAVLAAPTPGVAKRMSRNFTMRPDWGDVKITVMRDVLRSKFMDNDVLRQALLATGCSQIIEGNTWGDTFWGVCKGVGENHLGKLLMDIRQGLLLREMAGVYPGDPTGEMEMEACTLLGLPYDPVAVTVTFDPPQCQGCQGTGRDREGSRCQECGGNGVGPQGGLHPKAEALRSGAEKSNG